MHLGSGAINAIMLIAGFIDFIVDPCFQVMGDMMEAIMRPLQENKDEAQSQGAGATAGATAAAASNNNHSSSRSSSLSSRSSRRSTPSPIRTRKSKRLSYIWGPAPVSSRFILQPFWVALPVLSVRFSFKKRRKPKLLWAFSAAGVISKQIFIAKFKDHWIKKAYRT